MSDNILTKDRNDADLDIAAKDIAGKQYPRNILTDPNGNDLTPLTDAALRASAVSVSGAFYQATQPVSAAALPLPSGAATQATLSSVDSKLPGLGQALAAASVPVVLTAAQVTTLTPPAAITGFATQATLANIDADIGAQDDAAATTDTGTFSLVALFKRALQNWTTLLARVPAQGQAAMAASLPVALASNQSAIPVTASSPAALLTSYSQAGVIAINTVLLTLDCSQYRSVSLQCVSMGTTGSVTPEWSNDNATWVGTTMFSPNGGAPTLFTAAGLWTLQAQARYLRLRLGIATTAGTTTLSVHQFEDRPSTFVGTQPISGTVTATVTGGTTLPVTPTTTFTNSAATTNATSVKASAGTLWSVAVSNTNAAARFLKLYNKASAPTVGTDVPVITIPISPGSVVQVDGGANGIRFATGIAFAITAAAADSDTTAVAASEIKVSATFT